MTIPRLENGFLDVSVIAVGDFYQLPPVKGRPLYLDDLEGDDLWSRLFKVAELKTIVHKKELIFVFLTNRQVNEHNVKELLLLEPAPYRVGGV